MAFCPKCGTQLRIGAAFCSSCGSRLSQQTLSTLQREQQQAQQAQQPQQAYQPQQTRQIQQAYQPNNYYGATTPPAPGSALIDANRSLLVVILLSIVTCGIYSWWFTYKLAQDMNTVCNDGDKTPGLATFILLSIVTCGIYGYYWHYKIGNRQQANAPIYGFTIQENGTSVLLWDTLGIFLCGIGPFVALNIIIKNMNMLAAAYNNRILQSRQ